VVVDGAKTKRTGDERGTVGTNQVGIARRKTMKVKTSVKAGCHKCISQNIR
jgi:hypothetical protein